MSKRTPHPLQPQSWLLTIVGLALAACTVALGFWQVGRGQAKDAQYAQEAQAARVTLEGRWLPEHTIYLENRTMQGQTGFLVLTPLLRSAEQDVVLVQRGWMARDRLDPYKLQPLETPSGQVQISGYWTAWPSQYFSLGTASNHSPIYTNIQAQDVSQSIGLATGLPVYIAATLREEGPASQGLLRQWDSVHNTSSKNYAYALQWFIIALVVIGLTLWFQWLQPMKKRQQTSSTFADSTPQS